MAKLNERGNIIARCPDCNGRESNFIYNDSETILGAFGENFNKRIGSGNETWNRHYRLFKCSSCGRGE